jgi:hypothetical protein
MPEIAQPSRSRAVASSAPLQDFDELTGYGHLWGGRDDLAGKGADFGLGLIETFIIGNFKTGWSPKAYFDGLRKLGGIEKSMEKI